MYAEGASVFSGVSQLPYFYEDRMSAIVDGINQVGGDCRWDKGMLQINGQIPEGGDLDSAGNDLVALAFLLLSARCRQGGTVRDCQKLLNQIPNLEEIMVMLGLKSSLHI